MSREPFKPAVHLAKGNWTNSQGFDDFPRPRHKEKALNWIALKLPYLDDSVFTIFY